MIKLKKILPLIVALSLPVVSIAQNEKGELTVSGRIVDDSNKKPLAGIRISQPGISSAMTDDEGKFTIKVSSRDTELKISGPGYQAKRIAIKGRESFIVSLQEEGFKSVYHFVGTPLGEVNNAEITASTVVIDDNNTNSIAMTPEQLLQGRVPGLNTMLRSGMVGNGGNMFLQGFNSIYTNTQPLLVVDGMVIENQSYGMSLIENCINTPFGAIDVKDISRITVMKDGASIYGVKGANGVIFIETLRSKDLATQINATALFGMMLKPNYIPMLNASEHKKYLADMYQSGGMSVTDMQKLAIFNPVKPTTQSWGVEGNADYYRYNKETDWQDELFEESYIQKYGLSVTGGDDIALYAVTLGFTSREGIIRGTDYNRFNARINTDINFSPKLKVKTNMSFVYGKRNIADEGGAFATNPIYSSLVKSPFMAPNIYNELDKMSPNLENVDVLGFSNPVALINRSQQEGSNYRFLGTIGFDYTPIKGLNIASNFGLHFNKEREKVFYPSNGMVYDTLSTALVTNKLQHRVERLFSLFNETNATYTHKFASDNVLTGTAGMRYQHTSAEDDWGKGYNSASDNYRSINYGLSSLRQAGGSLGEWNWLAYYMNLSYALKNRYYLNATISADASSRYGSAINNFQIFPAISGAWMLSSEEFMKSVDWIDMLKIRAGYSVTGNDDIGNYTARHYYNSQNMLGNYGLIRGNIVNSNLKPERKENAVIGLDLALLNERLSLSAEFYKSRISDLITHSTASPISGFNTYISNGGEMENRGVDLGLQGRIINSAVKWDMGITASFNKNKITKLQNNSYLTEICNGTILTQVGQPIGLFYGYKTDGVYSTAAEAATNQLYHRSGLNDLPFTAGDVRFVNMNGDRYIDKDDMQVIGNPNPDVYGGAFTSVQWKNFTLSAQFTYSVGNDVYNYTRRELESMSTMANQTKAVLNRWKVDGQQTNTPKAVIGDPMDNSRFSDRWIEDGSFLRLKNITLQYDIPVSNSIITGMQVYGVAENLFTITGYKGYDPEFNASINPLAYGVDAFSTPLCRTFYVGIRIGL